MAEIIKMPKMSDTMTEGTVISWLKKVGDKVQSGDILAEIETDKATMELESYDDGYLLYIGANVGDKVPVGNILAIIGDQGEEYESLLQDNKSTSSQDQSSTEETPAPEANQPSTSNNQTVSENASGINKSTASVLSEHQNNTDQEESRIFVSPLAKKIAKDMNIDLTKIKGSGPNDRIIKRDLENTETNTSATTSVNMHSFEEEYYDESISSMRNTIAKRLVQSLAEAPHFYLTMDVNMDKVVEMRDHINNALEQKISFNDIITKAVALAIEKYPNVNVSWQGDKIRYFKHVHLGIAVAINDGLVVPNLKFANKKSLKEISNEIKDLAGRAKSKSLSMTEMQGSTFCISNLGMYGIESFTSIINPPSACILAIGGIKKIPICDAEGNIKPGNVLKLTMSCDHRVVDGAIGAHFLSYLKDILEEPIKILL